MSPSEIENAVIRACQEAGRQIAAERGWYFDPEWVARRPLGGISITWALPNDWFHRQYVTAEEVWFSRCPLVDQLRHKLSQHDLGGPMPIRFAA